MFRTSPPDAGPTGGDDPPQPSGTGPLHSEAGGGEAPTAPDFCAEPQLTGDSTYEDFKEWIKCRRPVITDLDGFEDEMRLWSVHLCFALRRGRVERYNEKSTFSGRIARVTYECCRARTAGKRDEQRPEEAAGAGGGEVDKGGKKKKGDGGDRIGCPWKVTVCFSQASQSYHISTELLDHNHDLDLSREGRRMGGKRKRKTEEDIEEERKRKAAQAALTKAQREFHNDVGEKGIYGGRDALLRSMAGGEILVDDKAADHLSLAPPVPPPPPPPSFHPSSSLVDEARGRGAGRPGGDLMPYHEKELCVVMGVGAGVGGSCAKRFASAGYTVGLVGREEEKLKKVQDDIKEMGGRAHYVVAEVGGKEADVQWAFKSLKDQSGCGAVDVLVYNCGGGGGARSTAGLLDLNVEAFKKSLQSTCVGALICAKCVAVDMLRRGGGTILFMGSESSLRGAAKLAPAACGKFALRGLAQSLGRELHSSGVHVVHVVIDGLVGDDATRAQHPERKRESFLDPAYIAEAAFTLHSQDRSAWTQELELRPFCEPW